MLQGTWRSALAFALLWGCSSACAWASAQAEGDSAFARAAEFYRAERYQDAAEAFEAFRRQFPAHPRAEDAIFFGAESRVELGDAARAADSYRLYLERAAASAKFRPRALFRMAECDVWLGNLRSADQLFQEFCGLYSDDPLWARGVLSRAEIAVREQRYDEAREGYTRLCGDDAAPITRTAARFGLARLDELTGNRAAAREAYDAIAADRTAEASYRSKAQLQLAYMDYAERNFSGAAARLTEILAADSTEAWSLDARYWRGMCYYALGNYARARDDYRQTLTLLPQTHAWAASLRRYHALASAHLEEWDAVEHAIAQWLDTSDSQAALADEDLSCVVQLAQQAARQSQTQLAYDWLQQLRQRDEDRFVAHTEAQATWERLGAVVVDAVSQESSGQPVAEAPSTATATATASQTSPADTPSVEAATEVYLRLLDAGQLAELWRQLTEGFEDGGPVEGCDQIWARLADAHRAEGNRAQEADACQQLVEHYPDSPLRPTAALRWARLMAVQGDLPQADRILERCLAEDASHQVTSAAWFLKGEIAGAAGRWQDVVPAMQRSLERLADARLRAQATYWMAEAHYRQQDYPTAHALFQALDSAADVEPAVQAMVLLRQAQMEGHQERWDSALARASMIADRFPDFRQLHEADYLIGRCRAALGDLPGARDAYARVVRSAVAAESETAAMAQWMIGETYLHEDDFEQALCEFLRVEAAYQHPQWQAAGLLQAGKCCERLGRPLPAAELYTRLLEHYSDTPFADLAVDRLRVLRTASRRTTSDQERER